MSTATIVVTGGALLAGAVYRYALTGRRSAAKLIDDSKRLHRAKDYGGSLAAATEACELGLKEGPTQHRLALLHLAALFHATRKFDEALDTLDQVEFTAGLVDDERDLVPVLHARESSAAASATSGGGCRDPSRWTPALPPSTSRG